MKNIIIFFAILISTHIFSQSNQTDISFSYKLNEDIKESAKERYLNVRDYLIQDSVFSGKLIYFSPYLADLDYFYFKDNVSKDSILSDKVFFKYKWFDDYYSSILNDIIGKQDIQPDYIAFFSLIENDMLRVDVFLIKNKTFSLRFEETSLFPGTITHAYLFDFKKKSNEIRSIYKIDIIYD